MEVAAVSVRDALVLVGSVKKRSGRQVKVKVRAEEGEDEEGEGGEGRETNGEKTWVRKQVGEVEKKKKEQQEEEKKRSESGVVVVMMPREGVPEEDFRFPQHQHAQQGRDGDGGGGHSRRARYCIVIPQ